MKKTLHFIHLIKKASITFCMLLFLFSSAIGFAQTITPTKTVTVAPGVCGALDVELKIQGSNPVARPLEVVLVIDVSGSMGDGNNPKPLAYAQDAAIDFINKMFTAANNPTGKNKVGIVTYSTTATIRRYLTNSSGQADLISVINGLSANGSTNIQDGLVKAREVLDPTRATYDCATARSVVLLTDGVPNVTGTGGNSCSGSCLPAIQTAANNIKTVTVSGTTYNNQIFSVGLFGAISGSDQTNAENVLNTVQSGGSFFTETGADLTGIYTQIFTQLSWVAKAITGTPFEKETIGANFTIGSVSVTKGTTTITGQEIAWNIDFLNVETITLKYRLTPKPNTCGSQQVSTSKLFFQNAVCANSSQDIVSPMTDVPCPIITVASQTNVKCFGGNDGAITINNPTGGQGPYTFKWTKNGSDFATTQNISNLSAGTYKVSATDNNNCATGILTIEITQPAGALAIVGSSKTDVLCYGASTGSVTAGTISNAVGTVTYSWKNSSNAEVGTTPTVSNLPAGSYTVTITDSCSSKTDTVTIGQPTAVLTAAVNTKVDVNCKGDTTGSATASATGGTGAYSYSWNTVPVQTGATATGLKAGTYIVTVTDANLCTDTEQVIIDEPTNALVAAIDSHVDVSCKGDATGSATASASGGTAGYSYSWNTVPAQNTAIASGLKVGTYTVTVTDSKGCTDTETVTIEEPTNVLTAAIDSHVDVNCKGDATGSATASATGGTAGYSYSWNTVPVQNTATASNLASGTYIVTVTDSKGCTDTETVTIGEPTNALTAAIDSHVDVSCKGDATGSATASASGGTAGYSYSWNTVPVQNTATASNLAAGTYIVTVTDSNGCTDTETVTIKEPENALLAAIDSHVDVSCKGDATGSVTASASGGTAGYSYSWNTVPVQNTATASNLIAGTYIVTVTDSKGCTDTETVTIKEPENALLAAIDSHVDVSCKGDATGSATASASGGTAGYSYSWNTVPVQNTATASNLPTGTYIVTVTDAKGCTDTETVTIKEPENALLATIDSHVDVSCKGDATGSATASATGGTAGYSYSWNTVPSQNTATASNLPAGTYIVTVTDSKGCTDTETVTIKEPENALLAAIDSHVDVSCKGDATGSATASATGGTAGYSYSWNTVPVQNTATASNLPAGTYIVTVTDSKGCTDTETVTIKEPENALLAAIDSHVDVSCKGDATGSATASATGGTAGYSYSWNTVPVQNTATASNLVAGTYIVTVTDAKGCTDTETVTIKEPENALLAAIDSHVDVSCKGDATGSATASATGGTAGYSYSWNTVPVQNTATATNLVAGTYIVTVTDSKGCTDTETVTIKEPENALTAAIDSHVDVSCKGDATGSATASATGGTAGYSYSWNTVPVQNTATASNLAAGTYIVTVTDSKGCTDTETVTIGEPTAVLSCSVVQNKAVSSNGLSDGEATVTPLGGNGGYTYLWDNNETTQKALALSAGSHSVTVTDSKGCKTTCTVTITEPNVLSCSITQDDPAKCFGDSNGKATVVAVGGNGEYTYLWDNGETTAQATGLTAGTHQVTVTDKLGYTTKCSVEIGQPQAALNAAIDSHVDVSCKGDATGSATASATGGNGNYSYSWNTVPVQTGATASNLVAGTYIVTVTDAKGCTDTETVTIKEPENALLAAIDSHVDVSCKGDATGSATASATGGTAGYSYSWNTVPVQNTATASNLAAGTYIVTVTDSKGCTDTETVTIKEPENALLAAIDSHVDVSCKGDATGSATASATGGTAGYSYSWNTVPVQNTATASNLVAGTYIVTVTDSKGCTDTETVTIGEPTAVLSCSVVQNKAVSSNGLSDGEATVTPLGGNGGYTYLWDNNETTQKALALSAGSHSVTVTDSKGCKTTCTVTITEPNVLSCSITQDDPAKCFGDSNGKATVVAVGGNGEYTYLWDNGETTAQATGLTAGTHQVTVTDKLGYTTKCSVEIGQPQAALNAAIDSHVDVSCKGDATGSATASATGGNGNYSYSWNTVPVQTGATASNLVAGTYIVTVTDAKGCTDTETVTIKEPENALLAAIDSHVDVSCKGDATGSATASATGGTAGYSYSWNTVPVQNTATATNLVAGTYIVTVTDSKGCTDTEKVTIKEPENALTAAIDSHVDVSCKGDATGSATASATGGTAGYSYSWNTVPVQNTATATNLVAGTYIVTVTDSKGCTDTETVTIGEPANPLTATKSQINPGCGGAATGSATVVASGGTAPYTYSWNTNPEQTTATASNLASGSYTVIITDAKGCKHSESFEIIDGDSILPVIDPLPATSTINCPEEPVFAQATASDLNGTISSLTYEDTVTPGNCPGSYTKTRTWTAKDACGNVSLPVSQTIIVQDITAPTWTTQTASLNRKVECSDTAAIASAQALFPTATDACDSDVSNIVKVSGQFVASEGCTNAGTYTNTWTVKDECGNTSETFTQVITIEDTTAPTWTTAPEALNATLECSDTAGLANAQAMFPTASDLCDADVSNIIKVSGQFVASEGCGNSGTYTNTWTVKDDCGNTSATFTQIITIEDKTAPIWNTVAGTLNVTLECSDTVGLAAAQAQFPTASDLCDTDVSNIIKVSGQFVASEGCGNSGTYTNTWTVKDDCGNISLPFTQVIIIQDTTAPTWTTQTASLNTTIECSNTEALASAQALFPTATDACDTDVSNIVKVSGQFVASEGCSNAGTYTNTWTVKDDCGNTSEIFTQVITIQDTTKPVFNGELPSDITVSCDAVPEPANIQATDNCGGGDLPIVLSETKSDIKNECGTEYTLTRKWTTSDCSGNTASFTQIITVRDTTPPTGTAPADVAGLQSTAEIPTGSPSDITDAKDNCSGNVTITVSDSNNGANGCDGNAYILTRTYTLTDCAGNKTELVQTFTVDNKVSVSGVPTNVSCLDGTDGSIAVTSSPGATVVITNANNEVVGNTNLPAGTYTLTATAPVNGEGQVCTATATVTITQPNYKVKVSGQVINVDTNTPIANVPVTLIPQGTTPGPILIRITNVNGEYSFSGMVAGSYLVQVQDANLNSAYQLYPVNSSLFFTTLEECKFQVHDFLYGKSKLPVLGDYVWYDTNSNGIQDEWYDANNDGVVTKNIPDSNGAIDYSQWEWLDLNGDGSYVGPQNAGELNAGGFGNDKSANVIVDGPNGYHDEVIVGIQGFWRNRPDSENPYGEYKVKLVKDANLDAVAAALGATGLVKVLPSANTNKKATSKTGKIQMHTVCTTTSADGYIVNVTPEDLVHLDLDFGVNCKELQDIVANDDNAGPFPGVNHTTPNVINVLTNDTLEGQPITASEVVITTVTPNEFLQLNPDGSVDILPNAPAGTLTMVYQICEADQTSNCDTATVTITIEAPVMTVTATSICVNDVPYLDYTVTNLNFTPINGVTIAWADRNNNVVTTMTDLPLSGRVLWPGAIVDQNGNGVDWPGWVFQDNKWIEAPDGFEKLRPTVNITISVNPSETITVNYPPADPYCTSRPTFAIVANDDTAGPINGITGGTNVINVYTNDTLNGSPVNPSDVTLTTVTPDPKGALTLNPDGSITVAPNTPAGIYTLTYQICENADFGNCDTAIVTVTVGKTPIVANDDSFTNIGCGRFGLIGNVLSNDLLNQSPLALQLVNFSLLPQATDVKSDPNITVDASGNLNVTSLTVPGTYTYTYQICEKLNPDNCDTGTITITVAPSAVVNLSSSACTDDSTLVDLLALLPSDTPRDGTWVDTNGTNALQGNILNPFGLALGNYVFEYKVRDANCPRSVMLNMEVNDDCKVLACGDVVVHNAFSPNGDGINDVFVIDSIDELTCYPGNTVEIYNRWGILVFETTDYNNTTNAFDGTSRGRTTVNKSEGLPTGTYFYIVTYKSLDGNNVIQYNKKDGYLYLSR